jgi:3,4-dihydroxy 2-butanone 4-phosphate synthase / GTP cyclohydrolase II
MTLSRIEDAVEAIRQGGMVILVDEEDRENEGDLVMAAQKVTPEAINFMARYARGLICLSLTDQRLRELEIPMMVQSNTSPLGTAFTVSIEARTGVTTGISAADRARTIQVAVADESGPDDLTRPGHVFPLKAARGGVLARTGQTEGSVDLCRLAGLKPAGVICEIMRDDGEMARMPDLVIFAERHGLPIVSIADLIRYRLERESLVEKALVTPMQTEFGEFQISVYRSHVDHNQHFAVVKGDPSATEEPVLVRVQHQCLTSDVFHSTSCHCGRILRAALRRIQEDEVGVVLYMYHPEHSRFENVLTHVLHQETKQVRASDELNRPRPQLRHFGVGAQILRDLGVRKMRIMLSSPRKIVGLAGYGLEVVEQFSPLDDESGTDEASNVIALLGEGTGKL